MKINTLLLLLSVPLAACGDVSSPDKLFDAPTRVVIAQTPVTLETYIYRDFAPITPPGGQPMIAVVTVKAENRAPLPAGLSVVNMYVMHGDSVWAVAPVQESPPADPSELRVVARGGPKWTPGISVDVVAELRHGGTSVVIKAPDQPLHRTD